MAFALLTISTAAAAQRAPVTVLGYGANSCGDWTKAKVDNGPRRAMYDTWVGGFITGMNVGGMGSYGNLNEVTDYNGMLAWIDNYCAAHPLDNVGSAALTLTTELIGRKTRHP